MLRILLVEDELHLRESITQLLNMHGFMCNSVGSIASYVAWRESQDCDVLIVDRKLPDGDGMDIVKMHRQSSDAGIVLLTSLASSADKVLGYNNDCDLYMEKPVEIDELIAAINNLQRRKHKQISLNAWVLDMISWQLHGPNQQSVKLTERETKFLQLFVDNIGITIPRQDIASVLGIGTEFDDYKRLEIIVRRLRKKVLDSVSELPLLTIYGQGFVFNDRISIVNKVSPNAQ